MKILIIEDEAPAAKRLALLVKEIDSQIEILATIDSIEYAIIWLQNNIHPEIILLDIELSDGKSFEIFKQISVKSAIIFTTAYEIGRAHV